MRHSSALDRLDESLELREEELFRLGGTIVVDGRVSWFPPDARGFSPSNCYLLPAGSTSLLIDTGFAATEKSLHAQLSRLIGPGDDLWVYVTRLAEFDTVAGIGPLVSTFPVSRALNGVAYAPLDTFAGFQPRFEMPNALDTTWPEDDVDWGAVPVGADIEFGLIADEPRRVKVLAAPLRLLHTVWLYDELTSTLFTSDAFSHVGRSDHRASSVVRPEDDDPITVADVRRHLLGKFDWLAQAETDWIRSEILRIFDEYRVEIIAPSHGCVLQGEEVVGRHLDLTISALEGTD